MSDMSGATSLPSLASYALALGLSLTLGACRQASVPSAPQPLISSVSALNPQARYTLSGEVLAPSELPDSSAQSLVAQSLSSQSLSQHAWDAPHVAGQVLLRPATLPVQSVSGQQPSIQQPATQQLASLSAQALSGIRTQRLGSALTLAYTPANTNDAAFAATLAKSGWAAQPNYRYASLGLPDDPALPGNAGIEVGGVRLHQDYLSRINAAAAWETLAALNKPVQGALTAVLDTGVDFSHEDLNGQVLPGYDFCSALDDLGSCLGTDADASDLSASDAAGHGTATAGIIGAAGGNGKGLTGLAWSGQMILPVKVFGSGPVGSGATTASLAAGLDYAVAQGAKVINMSLGLPGSYTDPLLAAALGRAAAADVLLIAAAGNTANDGLYYPARDPNVMAVGALGNADELACYSARPTPGQKEIDLLAPGGAGFVVGCGEPADDLLTLTTTAQGRYELEAGTSLSAPQVSGAAALLRGLRPDLSAQQVRGLLIGSARPVSGGALLDVGAALAAAASFPASQTQLPASVAYSLKVQVWQAETVVASYTTSGFSGGTPRNLPYRIGQLPAGEYLISASLTVAGVSSSGLARVNVGGDTTQEIATR